MSNTSINFSKNIENLKYKLRSYDKLTFEKDWCSIPHSHPFCEILIITSGKGIFVGENISTPIKKGNIILTNPYISHTEYSSPLENETLEYTAISLTNVTFQDNNTPLLNSKIISALDQWNKITLFLNEIDQEIRKKEAFWESAVNSIINNLMIFILRSSRLKNSYIANTNVDRNSHIVIPIKKYLEEFYPNNINLDNLAKQFFMNKYSLLRRFKESTGFTPIEYLELTRINKAKDLIINTNFSITEIAIQTGFNNASYFSKKFKEIAGVTPTQFLKSIKEK